MGKINEKMVKRNKKRFDAAGKPALAGVDARRLALHGINPTIKKQLRTQRAKWITWINAKGSAASPEVRVTADTLMSNVAGAKRTFVGIGLDEFIATRKLKKKAMWKSMPSKVAKDVYSVRSRTADLIWATSNPAEPIAGHTPSVKRALVAGTKSAITSEHGTRDKARSEAVDKTHGDASSPSHFKDTVVMSQLATIKHMTSPSTELFAAQAKTTALSTPRYTALTGKGDIRQPAHFKDMVAHVQEERERKKWEVGAQMMTDPRLNPLVPPVIKNYLATTGNSPGAARELFRSDLHTSGRTPPVNTALHSDTQDLSTHSLHGFSKQVTPTTRPRALSDARILPPVIPTNARGQ